MALLEARMQAIRVHTGYPGFYVPLRRVSTADLLEREVRVRVLYQQWGLEITAWLLLASGSL